MRKLATVVCLTLGLAVAPKAAVAAPIGTNTCDSSSGISLCDIYADFTSDGASLLGAAEGNLGSYLPGYSLLLNLSADLSDGLQASDVADVLVVHNQLFELFSNTVFDSFFNT